MRHVTPLIYFVFILSCVNIINAQKDEKSSPIYDYSDRYLSNSDTIPDFNSKAIKLMITGIIYENDGKTPAKDVILYICQPDEEGNYELKRDSNRKRYVHHRAWVKTNADGRYTFYTFMPGANKYVKELKQIKRIIKAPGQAEQELNPFFFNDDPLLPDLTLGCRSQVVQSLLKLERQGNLFVANRDIKLQKSVPEVQ